jgi:diguanylate cyclase
MSKPKQDLGDAVLTQLKKLGVSSMPSNYEVYYHAMSGSNPSLLRALAELGSNPAQGEIDEVAEVHFPQRAEAKVVHNAQKQLTQQIGDLQSMATAEAAGLREFSDNMNNVSAVLGKEEITTQKAFEALGALIAAAKLKTEGTDSLIRDFAEQGVILEQTKKELDEARRLAIEDQTTGALNRRAFDDALHAIYETKDYFQYSLVLLDIDHFKKVNDKYGHPAGDKVLKLVATLVKENLRGGIPLYRFGGEEFGFFLKNLDSTIVAKVAERVRSAVEKMALSNNNGDKLNVTISLGYCMADKADDGRDLLEKADKALYASKQAGRNRSTNWATLNLKNEGTSGRYKIYEQARGL